MSKIYKITNKINNKIYIGKTNLSIEERFKIHCQDKQRREEEHRPLYSAMNKYGIENFQIELVEECLPEEASEKEKYWIEQYDSYHNGYNATLGGDGILRLDHSAIADRLREHPYPIDIAKEFGCCPDSVRNIAKDFNIIIHHKAKEGITGCLSPKKEVQQYTKSGEYVQTFSSTADAARWLFDNKCCKTLSGGVRSHIGESARGIRKTAYGYIWKYV